MDFSAGLAVNCSISFISCSQSGNSIKNIVREEVLKWQTSSLGLSCGTRVVLEDAVRKASENFLLKVELKARVWCIKPGTMVKDNSVWKNWPREQTENISSKTNN